MKIKKNDYWLIDFKFYKIYKQLKTPLISYVFGTWFVSLIKGGEVMKDVI